MKNEAFSRSFQGLETFRALMGAAMEKQSRKRVGLKLGAAFAVGLLLFILQFGTASLWDWLFHMFAMPLSLGVFFSGMVFSLSGAASQF